MLGHCRGRILFNALSCGAEGVQAGLACYALLNIFEKPYNAKYPIAKKEETTI